MRFFQKQSSKKCENVNLKKNKKFFLSFFKYLSDNFSKRNHNSFKLVMQFKHDSLDFLLSLVSLNSVQKKRIWSNSNRENEQKRGL